MVIWGLSCSCFFPLHIHFTKRYKKIETPPSQPFLSLTANRVRDWHHRSFFFSQGFWWMETHRSPGSWGIIVRNDRGLEGEPHPFVYSLIVEDLAHPTIALPTVCCLRSKRSCNIPLYIIYYITTYPYINIYIYYDILYIVVYLYYIP